VFERFSTRIDPQKKTQKEKKEDVTNKELRNWFLREEKEEKGTKCFFATVSVERSREQKGGERKKKRAPGERNSKAFLSAER